VHAVTVELDLVQPARTFRRRIDKLGQQNEIPGFVPDSTARHWRA
jgi:hypothetical protein